MTNLQRIRKHRGLTQKQLAEISGVNLKMIQKYEAGIKDINHARIITIWRLSVALDCECEKLLECTTECNGDEYFNIISRLARLPNVSIKEVLP